MTEKSVLWWGRVPLRRSRALNGARYPVRTLKGRRFAAKGEHVKPLPSPLARHCPLRLKPILGKSAVAVDLAVERGYGETVRGQARAASCIASGGRRRTPSNGVRDAVVGVGKALREVDA